MNLCVSVFLLLAVGLSLSSSALTPEECRPLVTPFPEFKPMYGRWTFIMGWSDNEVYDDMFKSTKSQWIDFVHSLTDTPNEMTQDIGIRHPSYCKYASTHVRIMGNSAISQKSNFTCTFHSLPTCRTCLLYHTTSINNNNLMAISNPTSKEQLTGYKALYLMSTKREITAAEKEHTKKQAECLGFKGDATFNYDPSNTFCHKELGD